MVIGFHVIFSTYGFWLPNDPRGSWSDFVGAWELVRFGKATKVSTTRSVARVKHDRRLRDEAKAALEYPPVQFTGRQALAVGQGFALAAKEGGYPVRACAILPEHVHVVLGIHARSIGRIVGHLKARATQRLAHCGRRTAARSGAGKVGRFFSSRSPMCIGRLRTSRPTPNAKITSGSAGRSSRHLARSCNHHIGRVAWPAVRSATRVRRSRTGARGRGSRWVCPLPGRPPGGSGRRQ